MTSNYRYLKRKFLNVLSFNYRGALAWNQLSNQIRDIKDLASFKRAISILGHILHCLGKFLHGWFRIITGLPYGYPVGK